MVYSETAETGPKTPLTFLFGASFLFASRLVVFRAHAKMANTSTLYSTSELAYTRVALTSGASAAEEPTLRADGRPLLSYRPIYLATNVSQAQGAIGSACVRIGGDETGSSGGSECWAGVRGDVVDVGNGNGDEDESRVIVNVEW